MTLTLGIDTASVVAAGLADAGHVVGSAQLPDTRAHVEGLVPLVEWVLSEAGVDFAELDAVAVGVGPGPFTGLRVGVAAALVIAEALRIPVKGVCGLDVLARQALRDSMPDSDLLVVTDARRKELYWASYSAAGERLTGPHVSAPAELPPLPVFGPAAELYPLPGPVLGTPAGVDAGLLAHVAVGLPDAGLEPLYLRRPDAEVSTARKSVLPQPRLAPRSRP
jgi:tRNA threonylcarbamoyl adenosine modification protein YeaZ